VLLNDKHKEGKLEHWNLHYNIALVSVEHRVIRPSLKTRFDTTLSHPDLRANSNARIHVRQDQVTHMLRLSEYQNTVQIVKRILNIYYMTECLKLTIVRLATTKKKHT
jgi:hypothetical protein